MTWLFQLPERCQPNCSARKNGGRTYGINVPRFTTPSIRSNTSSVNSRSRNATASTPSPLQGEGWGEGSRQPATATSPIRNAPRPHAARAGYTFLTSFTLLLTGCTQAIRQPVEITAPPSAQQAEKLDWSPLGLTLQRVLDGGTVKLEPLRESKDELTRLFAQIAQHGPKTTPSEFPDRDDRLVYWLNCHTAATLFSLALLAEGNEAPEILPPGFDQRFTFEVDGQFRSRADLAVAARKAANHDWRVELALPTVTEKGPPLPPRIFLADMLDAQFDNIVRTAFASPRVVAINHGASKQIEFWDRLWRLRPRLIADYESTYQTTDATMLNVLLAWTPKSFDRITLNSAVGYAEVPMPATRKVAWQSFEATDLIDAALGG